VRQEREFSIEDDAHPLKIVTQTVQSCSKLLIFVQSPFVRFFRPYHDHSAVALMGSRELRATSVCGCGLLD